VTAASMSVTTSRRQPRLSWSDTTTVLIVTCVAMAAGGLVNAAGGLRYGVAASLAAILALLAVRSRTQALLGLVFWLVVLGFFRRIVTQVSPIPAYGDPLLLVAAVAWAVLAALAVANGALRERTKLTSAVIVLTAALVVSAVNPLQGGPAVGLGGLLLVVVPMLAFFVGRSLVDDRTLQRVFVVVAAAALFSAMYGLAQSFRGMPSWDSRWVRESGYAALSVGGTIRAFANFSAASEYAAFLGVAIIIWVTAAFRVAALPIAAAAIALLGTAMWFESSRGIVVLTVASIGLVVSAWRGQPLLRSLVFGVLLIAAVPWAVTRVAPARFGSDPSSRLVAHQLEGLASPFDKSSTLPAHITMVTNGVRQALAQPLGRGVGSVTIAADKFAGAGATSTEADPSNAAVSVGIVGLLAYVAVVAFGFLRAHRVALSRRDPTSLAALGVLAVMILQWLNGGQYAVAFLPWLVLGWLDRPQVPPTAA
jgi:hypothetical protein